MKWISYLAILLVGIFLGFLGASLRVATVLDGNPGDPARPPSATVARVAELEEEVAALEADLAKAQARAEQAQGVLTSAGDGDGAKDGAGEGESRASVLAGMMENPVMREQIKQQLKGQISSTFAPLFRDQGFDEAEVVTLSDILLERQIEVTGASMDAMAGGNTKDPAKREETNAKLAEINDRYSAELKALLGDEKFNELERFEKTQAERQQIDSLRTQLADSSAPLTVEQEQALMDTMWAVREDPEFARDGNTADVMQGRAFPDDPDQLVDTFARVQAEVRSRAGEFLQPEQVEALEANQKAFLDMMRMGLKMSEQMMGGAAAE